MTRRTLVIAGAGCVALLGAWFLLFWSPAGSDLTAAKERVAEADRQSDELEVRLAQLLDAQRRLDVLAEAEGRYNAAIPAEPELAAFLLDAHAIASEAGVDFLAITPSPPVASTVSGPAAEIALTFNIDGGYFHVLDYLDALLGMPRLVSLETISLAPGGKGPQDGALSLTVTGRIFTSLPPGASAEDADPAAPTQTTVPDTVAAPGTTTEGGA